MHSLQALALMQENRIAKVGSLLMRSQRKASSTDCPGSNGTSKLCQRGGSPWLPRRIFSLATAVMAVALAVARFPPSDRSVASPLVGEADRARRGREGGLFRCVPKTVPPSPTLPHKGGGSESSLALFAR